MKLRIASLVLLVVVIVTSGFAPMSPTHADGITVTDALGRTVTLPKVPSRIVLSGKALFMVADAHLCLP